MKLLRQALTEAGWDGYEQMPLQEKRTFWQLVQKVLGGTGHTKEQATEWEEKKSTPGRKKYRKNVKETEKPVYLNY